MAVQDFSKAMEYQDAKGIWHDCLFIGRPLNASVPERNWIEFQDDKGTWVTGFVTDDHIRNKAASVAIAVINVYPDRLGEKEADEAAADAKADPDRVAKWVFYLVDGQPKVELRPIEKLDVDVPIDIEPIDILPVEP